MSEEKSTTVVDAVPTTLDEPEEGALRMYIGDDKKNLDCRFYEAQVSSSSWGYKRGTHASQPNCAYYIADFRLIFILVITCPL